MSKQSPADAPIAPPDDTDSLEWLTGHPALTTRQKQYLASLAVHGVITWAAAASGISPRTHYRWLKKSNAYREATDRALKQAAERIVSESHRRAIEARDERGRMRCTR